MRVATYCNVLVFVLLVWRGTGIVSMSISLYVFFPFTRWVAFSLFPRSHPFSLYIFIFISISISIFYLLPFIASLYACHDAPLLHWHNCADPYIFLTSFHPPHTRTSSASFRRLLCGICDLPLLRTSAQVAYYKLYSLAVVSVRHGVYILTSL